MTLKADHTKDGKPQLLRTNPGLKNYGAHYGKTTLFLSMLLIQHEQNFIDISHSTLSTYFDTT
eukprot:384113-Amphidinium_carterae.1